jgi:hypothetical protein
LFTNKHHHQWPNSGDLHYNGDCEALSQNDRR